MIESTQIMIESTQIGNIGKIKVSNKLQDIINKLHMSVGATEWSGVLFYRLTSGDIRTMKDLEFTAEFAYPMDIGNSVYTEFDFSGNLMNAYDIHENAIELSIGQIHTHHNMNTFFSMTDTEELLGNAKNYNFYISLIVNFDGNYCAKIAFPTKTSTVSTYELMDSDGKKFTIKINSKTESVLVGDLTVEIDENTIDNSWLAKRISELRKLKEDKFKVQKTIKFPVSTSYIDKDLSETRFSEKFNETKRYGDLFDDIETSEYTPKKYEYPLAKQFLSSLIHLNTAMAHKDIRIKLLELSEMNDDAEIELYAETLDNLTEIIHTEIYGSENNIANHAIDALTSLFNYKSEFEGSEIYEIIKNQLILCLD